MTTLADVPRPDGSDFRFDEEHVQEYREIVAKEVVNCAQHVYNNLGDGYQEQFYHKALEIEFDERDIEYQSEVKIPVRYKGHVIGHKRPDFRVGGMGSVLVEIKQAPELLQKHKRQLANYCKVFDRNDDATSQMPGLLINFPQNDTEYEVLNVSETNIDIEQINHTSRDDDRLPIDMYATSSD